MHDRRTVTKPPIGRQSWLLGAVWGCVCCDADGHAGSAGRCGQRHDMGSCSPSSFLSSEPLIFRCRCGAVALRHHPFGCARMASFVWAALVQRSSGVRELAVYTGTLSLRELVADASVRGAARDAVADPSSTAVFPRLATLGRVMPHLPTVVALQAVGSRRT